MNQSKKPVSNIEFNIDNYRPFFGDKVKDSLGARALKSALLLASIYFSGASTQAGRLSIDLQPWTIERNIGSEIGLRALSLAESDSASSLPLIPSMPSEAENSSLEIASHSEVTPLEHALVTETKPEKSKTPNSYKVASASLSEYKPNEDYCVITENSAVICDGVGSTKNGLLASSLAAEHISSELSRIPDVVEDSTMVEYIMAGLLLSSNQYIKDQQASLGNSMASTASVAKIVQRRVGDRLRTYAIIGNVGDSPVYVMRDGKVIEITNYHNRRKLPPSKKRPALGKQLAVIPRVYWVRLKKGDQLCLTSNGVSKSDPDKKNLTKVAKKSGTPQQTANRVVLFSNKKLTKDARSIAVLAA